MGYRVAVVGATGNVGRQMLAILAERNFPVDQAFAVASARSAHQQVSFGDDTLNVQVLESFDFSQVDIALFSPGAEVSAIYAPKAAERGCFVIDNTSHFRMYPDVPLVVPEINSHRIADATQSRIIANPNCSTVQMVMALAPIHRHIPVRRVVVATYQSVSGAGQEAMRELESQTKGMLGHHQAITPTCFPEPIAFNVIPQIDKVQEDGFTKEEWKMMAETPKILESDIAVVATCVRVPVFIGHALALTMELASPLSVHEAAGLLKKMPGVTLIDKTAHAATPANVAHEDSVYVARLRQDPTVPSGLACWVVADNLRKGAALNAVQIAEKLVEIIFNNKN
jgi:aspartate-semialdehyde dehydrogenase